MQAKLNQSVSQHEGNQHKEGAVVFVANAVVHPDAVMVKVFAAAVALAAVLGELAHATITLVAIELVGI